jgi:hypothetical protein
MSETSYEEIGQFQQDVEASLTRMCREILAEDVPVAA